MYQKFQGNFLVSEKLLGKKNDANSHLEGRTVGCDL